MSGGLPVALAYIGDLFTDPHVKEGYFGALVGCFVLGNSFGGIIAILMAETGLFAPLWVGVALEFAAFVICGIYLIEPGKLKPLARDDNVATSMFDDDAEVVVPETISWVDGR